MPDAPRSVEQALAYARAEHDHETQDWTNYCQRFVRSCYGIPALYGSAWAQWLGAENEDKHEGGDPARAPVGAALCYKGSGPYGHIMLAARPFTDDRPAAWSNDLVRVGDIDKVRRTDPTAKWGQRYLGYLTAVNGWDLNLREPTRPPRPRQTKRYLVVKKAIDNLEAGIELAIRRNGPGDKADIKVLRAEVRHLQELYDLLRHA